MGPFSQNFDFQTPRLSSVLMIPSLKANISIIIIRLLSLIPFGVVTVTAALPLVRSIFIMCPEAWHLHITQNWHLKHIQRNVLRFLLQSLCSPVSTFACTQAQILAQSCPGYSGTSLSKRTGLGSSSSPWAISNPQGSAKIPSPWSKRFLSFCIWSQTQKNLRNSRVKTEQAAHTVP